MSWQHTATVEESCFCKNNFCKRNLHSEKFRKEKKYKEASFVPKCYLSIIGDIFELVWLVFVKTIEYLLYFKYCAIVSQCFILLNPHSNHFLYVIVFSQFSDKEIKAQRSSTSKVTGNKWQTKIWTRCSDSIGVFYPPFY